MPSGKTHDRLTFVTAAASLPVWLVVSPQHNVVNYLCGVGAYLFSGFWLSDDLDTDSLCYKRWGLFKFLWWPYRTFVPHRSCLSHGPVIGPLLRVAYFAAAVWISARCAALVINKYFLVEDRMGILQHARMSVSGWIVQHPAVVIAAVVGLILGGLTHSAADALGSFWKRVW